MRLHLTSLAQLPSKSAPWHVSVLRPSTVGSLPPQGGGRPRATGTFVVAADRKGGDNTEGISKISLSTLAVFFMTPKTASAVEQVSQYKLVVVDDSSICTGCTVLGVSFAALSFLLTSRFLLSFWPALQKQAKKQQGPIALRTLVLLDGILNPAQKGLFRMGEEDVNYASVAFLAVMSMVLEVLFGSNGLLTQQVPDGSLLHNLQYMIYLQQMLLLPQWAMAVFRWFLLL